jgi:uncharacterized protein YdhG (YjbR/CyaY superfamily)
MVDNKTKSTGIKVEDFLNTISEKRKTEADQLIKIMQTISNQKPYMWGPSIIGFGQKHYKYDTGREVDTPRFAFSPRKSAITIYFLEGFDRYGEELKKLGKYKNSVSCLYINNLADIDIKILKSMLEKSYSLGAENIKKAQNVDEYISRIPAAAKTSFDRLRAIVRKQLPNAKEVLSYGIVGYKIDDKRVRVYISGWKDHVAMYPVPKSELLLKELKPYIKGKGTLWFPLDKPLPERIIKDTIMKLIA